MSKVRMSLRSRRMVRRHREWFALMDETGLTSDQLRCALALAQLCRDLSSVGEALGVAFSMFVECMSDAASTSICPYV